jgi:hypothetical protein
MESYLEERFGGVQAKNSSEEALRRWRRLCSVVKNPKRRFRFTANLEKRGEAEAIKHANHVRSPSLPPSRSFPLPTPFPPLSLPPGSALRRRDLDLGPLLPAPLAAVPDSLASAAPPGCCPWP